MEKKQREQELKKAIKKEIYRLGRNNPKAVRAAQAHAVWERVAPKNVLEHTDNVYLLKKEGIKQMIIYVDSSIWAADLSAQRERFRIMVENELQEGPLDQISFIASSFVGIKKAFEKRIDEKPHYIEDVQSVPLTEEERAIVIEQSRIIENEDLRSALIEARITDLEWKKGIDASKSL